MQNKISKRRFYLALALILVSAFLSFSFLRVLEARKEKTRSRPNVILIVIDALRSDHLSCYGYSRKTSPFIDGFAQEGVIFQNTIAQSSWTLPAVASLVTGMYPSAHKAVTDLKGLGQANRTLAEILHANNYLTAEFVESRYLKNNFGMAQGYDQVLFNQPKQGRKVLEAWKAWVEKNQRRRFFLFLHTYQTHQPYVPAAPFDKMFDPGYAGKTNGKVLKFRNKNFGDPAHVHDLEIPVSERDHLIALYDGEVAFADAQIKEFIEELKRLHLYDNSLIIITADHGEAFFEHRLWEHWRLLYDEVLKIPLLIKFPNSDFKGTQVKEQVRAIDIMPTVLEVLGLPGQDKLDGQSLLPLVKSLPGGSKGARPAFSDTWLGANWQKQIVSLRTGKYKYLCHFTFNRGKPELIKEELFDLEADPQEMRDLSSQEPGLREQMLSRVSRYQQQYQSSEVRPGKTRIDKETYRDLRALGYMQ